jgi:hypothetical protein
MPDWADFCVLDKRSERRVVSPDDEHDAPAQFPSCFIGDVGLRTEIRTAHHV